MQVQSYFSSLDSLDGELSTLNLGPTHPATHGIFQNVLKMDGEKNRVGTANYRLHPPRF